MRDLLFICTTPRTGSSMLRGDVRSTGVMGDPREWFNMGKGRRFEASCAEWGVRVDDLDGYIAALREHSATPNGVIGVKIFELHLQNLVNLGLLPKGPGRLRALAERFGSPDPAIIRLTRHDKLRQAISLTKAKQTGRWGTQGKARHEARYDRKQITADLLEMVERETRWDRELAESGYESHVDLIYEIAQHHREQALLDIARSLGLPDPERIVAERTEQQKKLERQADRVTEEWIDQFIGWRSGG